MLVYPLGMEGYPSPLFLFPTLLEPFERGGDDIPNKYPRDISGVHGLD